MKRDDPRAGRVALPSRLQIFVRLEASNFISNTILRPIKSIDEPVTVHIRTFQAINRRGKRRSYERQEGILFILGFLAPFCIYNGRIDACKAGRNGSPLQEGQKRVSEREGGGREGEERERARHAIQPYKWPNRGEKLSATNFRSDEKKKKRLYQVHH